MEGGEEQYKPRGRRFARKTREKIIGVRRVKESGKNVGKPWTVTGVYLDGKRIRRFFATRQEAEAFARLQKLAASRLGHYAERISPALAEEALRCQEAL
ncbi:MAG: hypothetical protein PHP75_02280 [Methylacidiphilaceae bacterium]|nr:hypothetical protein [Candidatus Methylacidiphilaceae bacterium]